MIRLYAGFSEMSRSRILSLEGAMQRQVSLAEGASQSLVLLSVASVISVGIS